MKSKRKEKKRKEKKRKGLGHSKWSNISAPRYKEKSWKKSEKVNENERNDNISKQTKEAIKNN